MLDGSLAWNDRSANKADTRRVEGSRGLSVWRFFPLHRPLGVLAIVDQDFGTREHLSQERFLLCGDSIAEDRHLPQVRERLH
jgi:hypothetical protein